MIRGHVKVRHQVVTEAPVPGASLRRNQADQLSCKGPRRSLQIAFKSSSLNRHPKKFLVPFLLVDRRYNPTFSALALRVQNQRKGKLYA